VTTSGKSDPASVKAPGTVSTAFWLAISGMTVIVLLAVLTLAVKNQSIALAIEYQATLPADQRITPEKVRDAINLGVWLNLGVSVVFGLLGAYFVRQVRAGDRKARMRFTIAAVMLVLMMLFIQGLQVALIPLVALLCVITAVILVFSRSATTYLNEQ
jgi:uncharacterized membrane protein